MFLDRRSEAFLKDREKFIIWMAQSLYYGDNEEFYELLKTSLKLVNKNELATKSGVPIATIYRMINSKNFKIESLFKILKAISTHY
jgi:predicted transcriptional regulator